MQVVLVEPEIPQNTGNIVRTCVLTGSILHLVGPLGFSLSDRHLKRAGLDYWELAEVHRWDTWEELRSVRPQGRVWLLSRWGNLPYHRVEYHPQDLLVFGGETRGLDDSWARAYPDALVRIPVRPRGRSLNLANSVAVVLYESLRQQGFPGLV